MVQSYVLQLATKGNDDLRDITAEVADVVRDSGLKNGIVTIFCPSSTSGATTIEYEPGCLTDFRTLFEEILPVRHKYAHDALSEDGNGHSHIRASLLGASLTVPFVDSHLMLGTWQQIIFADFDIRPRKRQLVVQLLGE